MPDKTYREIELETNSILRMFVRIQNACEELNIDHPKALEFEGFDANAEEPSHYTALENIKSEGRWEGFPLKNSHNATTIIKYRALLRYDETIDDYGEDDIDELVEIAESR